MANIFWLSIFAVHIGATHLRLRFSMFADTARVTNFRIIIIINRTGSSVCSGNVALCQITLTAC